MSLTRRQILKSALFAGAAATFVPRHLLGGEAGTAPNDRVTLAGIGIGGIGHPQLKDARDAGFQVVALCDVDDVHAKKTYDVFPEARKYRDFRDLLNSEGDKIDAVYCGTPDHTHAIITLAALRAKKHVCCVKPLTRTIEEGRAVLKAVKEAGTATQVTMQPSTSEQACRIMELIYAGAIGEIREIHAWSGRPVWPQGMLDYPNWEDPVPSTFDWDLWLGPAEKRPFADQWPENCPYPGMACANWGKRGVYHPFNFRGWFAFGTGSLGDMGCHRANLPYRMFRLKHPTRITASSTRAYSVSYPIGCMVTYDYPASEDFPEIRLTWYDGGLKPAVPKCMGSEMFPAEGVLYVGTEGMMFNDRILDPERAEKFANVPKTIERRGGVMPEWYEACRGGQAASANFEYAIPVTEFVLLGNLAVMTGKAVEFDPETLTIANNPEAQALISQPYHNGWTL
ncbi:MAG: Gfo/Idh/MocA family oxidoreductase [Thermoguttaceae bacterium]|nr:Gfo/Idh/MocA family oxidoreductase [Thermoguttaceae bacterium]